MIPGYLWLLITYSLIVFSAYQTLLLIDFIKYQIREDDDDGEFGEDIP